MKRFRIDGLLFLKNSVTMIKAGKISRNIACMRETRNVYKMSVGKFENKILVYLISC
jgi:hypothetical protein